MFLDEAVFRRSRGPCRYFSHEVSCQQPRLASREELQDHAVGNQQRGGWRPSEYGPAKRETIPNTDGRVVII